MFDLHRLRLLRELSQRGTLAAVAQALNYSPSSVSQQLSLLETEVGVPLLEPVGRRVKLTPQAEILVRHTEEVLARLEQAESEVAASLHEITGTLRVATFQTAALALIPATLARMRDEHPSLRIEFQVLDPAEALSGLNARDFDLVFLEEWPDQPEPRFPDLEYRELFRDPIRLAVPRGLPITEIGSFPWIMETVGMPQRLFNTNWCRHQGYEPDVRFASVDVLVKLRFVERGLAVALLPDLIWYDREVTVDLHELPVPQSRLLFTAARAGRGQHPAVRAFREALAVSAVPLQPRL
ncbi:LysR substrate-binding domain-containing protein [Lentzea sp. BCCO 10_0856]|uniref:LysR substrate-binding domain-containing protein n=1 Tax=Lentzea miocenica TaxID=3095431 RepID=A0ABU4SXS1_9PSEU|nr:LysR substrate-binding domain-containing protein [Lentzea sp. BCCO 10_0856]MDX8030701.1 LysR substrate-binding domain-containing protein [Lentzea sp. BCCO 10_0856]